MYVVLQFAHVVWISTGSPRALALPFRLVGSPSSTSFRSSSCNNRLARVAKSNQIQRTCLICSNCFMASTASSEPRAA
jgi:hypothetical protein